MGMYNEVFCMCPNCGGSAYCQVRQYVLGFGGFHLQNPDSFDELTEEQLEDLYEELKNSFFSCEDCGEYFNPYKESPERKRILSKIIRN